MDFQQYFDKRQSRRSVLQKLGTLAVAGLTLDACGTTSQPTLDVSSSGSIDSIKHVVVCCQENRTFDTYFGYYPKAGRFGIPADYSQPDGKGGTVKPHHLLLHEIKDISNDW